LRVPDRQYGHWKIKRKIENKGEWDEDDDAVSEVPFHAQDDDATNSNQLQMEENEAETYLERYNDGLKENSAKIKEEAKKKEKGIVYSNSTGDKESEIEEEALVPPPPSPSLPSSTTENAKENEKVAQVVDTTTIKQNSTSNEVETIHNTTSQSHTTNIKHNTKHKNEQTHQVESTKPADTIFDDLLHGFTFAATFCVLILCIYKFCWYVCVKCGIFPDERVMNARWRRHRLKNKRAYGDSNVIPPLDTRQWAEWSAKRGRVNGGVWDGGFDDIKNNLGYNDDDDGSEAGAILFDNSGIEMAEWEEEKGNESGSDMELEYGEGEELEDKSHDERLFDANDDGRGVENEADRFFGKQKQTSKEEKKLSKKKHNDKPETESEPSLGDKKDEAPSLLVNASFDALEPPSGEIKYSLKPGSNGYSSSISAKEFLLEVTSGNNHASQDSNGQNNELDDMSFEADDRGYDEDADLLGLKSDSPPPLDLEEIEKKLVEDMKNATFY
jgi:hypothetical protein